MTRSELEKEKQLKIANYHALIMLEMFQSCIDIEKIIRLLLELKTAKEHIIPVFEQGGIIRNNEEVLIRKDSIKDIDRDICKEINMGNIKLSDESVIDFYNRSIKNAPHFDCQGNPVFPKIDNTYNTVTVATAVNSDDSTDFI